MTVIESERLRLREVDERDIDGLERLFTDPAVMRHYAQVARPGAGAKWLAAVRKLRAASGYAPWTVELHDGTFVGQCGPMPQVIDGRPDIEMIFFFTPAFWRGDFAKEAGEACLRVAFGPLRLARIIAVMYPENRPSVRLALRCGLRFERRVDKDGRPMLIYTIDNPALDAPRILPDVAAPPKAERNGFDVGESARAFEINRGQAEQRAGRLR